MGRVGRGIGRRRRGRRCCCIFTVRVVSRSALHSSLTIDTNVTGGGYIVGSPHPAGGPIGPISSVLLAHAPAISRIFAPGYRLSSSSPYPQLNPFPAALIDALAAYHHLIHVKGFDPKNIIVGGDSAGGNLALAVVRYIVREKIGALAVPGALLLLSPTAEWEVTHTGPKASMTTNASSDFCNIFLLSGYTARSLLGSSLPSTFIATSPYISPSSLSLPSSALPGLFAGFPRTYISAGGAEVCLDMYRTLRERMERDIGSGLVYDEEPEGTHDFLTMDWHEPERSETAKRIGKWVEGL
jgi:acetyl esterase/lipase